MECDTLQTLVKTVVWKYNVIRDLLLLKYSMRVITIVSQLQWQQLMTSQIRLHNNYKVTGLLLIIKLAEYVYANNLFVIISINILRQLVHNVCHVSQHSSHLHIVVGRWRRPFRRPWKYSGVTDESHGGEILLYFSFFLGAVIKNQKKTNAQH